MLASSELLQWMQNGKIASKDFVLVDLRRNDHDGGTIKGSINLPAQSLYPSISTLYSLFSAAGVKHVIWYCCKYGFYSLMQPVMETQFQ